MADADGPMPTVRTAEPAPRGDAAVGAMALAAGSAGAGLLGTAGVLLAVPARAILDYPQWDAALRIAPAASTACAVAGLAATALGARRAWRTGTAGDWLAGFLGVACLAATVSVWNGLEAFESDRVRERVVERQEVAAAITTQVLRGDLAAFERMAARGMPADPEAWQRDATVYRVDMPGLLAVAACAPDGAVRIAVPEDAAALLGSPAALDAIRSAAAPGEGSGAARLVPLEQASGRARLLAVARSGDGTGFAFVLDPQAALAPALEAVAPGCALAIRATGATGMPTGSPDAGGDAAADGAAGAVLVARDAEGSVQPTGVAATAVAIGPTPGPDARAWRLEVRPTRAWLDAQHDRANTVVLALGVLLSAGVALLVAAATRSVREGARARALQAAARAGEARTRVAERAREAIAHESAHVLRARVRETARALDVATDARADETVRREALRRVGASLAQAEAEIAALLEPPPHSRLTRLLEEDDLVPHYAAAVLEFDGGPTVHLDRPVPAGALAAVQHELGSQAFAIVTSDNPMSSRAGAETNELRRGVLALELRTSGVPHRPVVGRSPDAAWSEHSFAVATTPVEADALASLHGQRAYYWFDGTRFVVHEVVGRRRTIALPLARGAGTAGRPA